MIKQAIELIRQGKLNEASQLIYSDDYNKQKTILTDGSDRFTNSLNAHLLKKIDDVTFKSKIALGVAIVIVIGIFGFIWTWLVSHLSTIEKKFDEYEAQHLEDRNEAIERLKK
jgi:Fe2+ transport system protein B